MHIVMYMYCCCILFHHFDMIHGSGIRDLTLIGFQDYALLKTDIEGKLKRVRRVWSLN